MWCVSDTTTNSSLASGRRERSNIRLQVLQAAYLDNQLAHQSTLSSSILLACAVSGAKGRAIWHNRIGNHVAGMNG